MTGGGVALPEVSVIVAITTASATTRAAIDSIVKIAESRRAEVIVVVAPPLETLSLTGSPALVTVQGGAKELIPTLWARGIERARGSIIAFLDPSFSIREQWLDSVSSLASMSEEIAGIGGPIRLPSGFLPAADCAYFFTRYSRFLTVQADLNDIAGDNACYRAEQLRQYDCAQNNGFWENIFHEQLHERGKSVRMCEGMSVELTSCVSVGNFFASRFQHGLHYGSTRALNFKGRLFRILTSPFILPFLLNRIAGRVARQDSTLLSRLVVALPWLVYFLTAWSLGESFGYLKGTGQAKLAL